MKLSTVQEMAETAKKMQSGELDLIRGSRYIHSLYMDEDTLVDNNMSEEEYDILHYFLYIEDETDQCQLKPEIRALYSDEMLKKMDDRIEAVVNQERPNLDSACLGLFEYLEKLQKRTD